MPHVRIEMIRGKSRDFNQTLLDLIHEGLVESIGIADWDRFQRIIEIDREDFETSPEKTDDFMIIEITMFPGRTKEQKKALIETITGKISVKLSIKPTDIFIVINEPANENWGMGGNQRQG